jgi:2'-5' RNA ligase
MTTGRASDHSRTVTAVVCAAFDPATDDALDAVRELVRAAGVSLSAQPRHRPHFSLAAARVSQGVELDRLVAVAAEVARAREPIDVDLGRVGHFGRAGALWLGPDASPRLATLQRDVAAALAGAGWPAAFGERTEPSNWVPHCTLATRVPKPRLRDAEAAVRAQFTPIHATVDALATILVGGRGDVAHARLGGRRDPERPVP